jgi:hypothetical protein
MKRLLKSGLLLSLALLLLMTTVPAVTPVQASSGTAALPARSSDQSTTIALKVYLGRKALLALFQSEIDQQTAVILAAAINNAVADLPADERAFARQIATALLQPGVTLTDLQVEPRGLLASLRISLYDGDPHPASATLLLSFSVLNDTTLQVSATPLPGSPALASGPLATLTVPFGRPEKIETTPGCGAAALRLRLRYALALAPSPTPPASPAAAAHAGAPALAAPAVVNAANPLPASVEIPATSLASVGSSLGSVQVNSVISARNVAIAVQNGRLMATADLYLASLLPIGSATSTLEPLVSDGRLTFQVQQTSVTLLALITFPYNRYNQQITQMLNGRLASAFGNNFTVSRASIGPTASLPCAAADSLVLEGTVPAIS